MANFIFVFTLEFVGLATLGNSLAQKQPKGQKGAMRPD
jgi:hypothetical protein